MTKVLVTGAAGRMGARITSMVIEDPALELVGIIEREGYPSQGQPRVWSLALQGLQTKR